MSWLIVIGGVLRTGRDENAQDSVFSRPGLQYLGSLDEVSIVRGPSTGIRCPVEIRVADTVATASHRLSPRPSLRLLRVGVAVPLQVVQGQG
jgi:hypothetical protein